jgi:hypothetical protein
MREVDRVAMGEFGLLLIQMMENAGLHLAERDPQVPTPCGCGASAVGEGNGGGGLVAARHPRLNPTPLSRDLELSREDVHRCSPESVLGHSLRQSDRALARLLGG